MLTVGVDTYATIEIASAYLSAHYPSTDERVEAWNQLPESDREVYLRRACAALNTLPFRGVTYTAVQPLAFPRYFGVGWVLAYRILIAPEAIIYPELQDVPQEIIAAQIEEALELGVPGDDTAAYDARTNALTSFSIGQLSESYGKAVGGSIEATLHSSTAQEYVRPFVGGSYDIV